MHCERNTRARRKRSHLRNGNLINARESRGNHAWISAPFKTVDDCTVVYGKRFSSSRKREGSREKTEYVRSEQFNCNVHVHLEVVDFFRTNKYAICRIDSFFPLNICFIFLKSCDDTIFDKFKTLFASLANLLAHVFQHVTALCQSVVSMKLKYLIM